MIGKSPDQTHDPAKKQKNTDKLKQDPLQVIRLEKQFNRQKQPDANQEGGGAYKVEPPLRGEALIFARRCCLLQWWISFRLNIVLRGVSVGHT